MPKAADVQGSTSAGPRGTRAFAQQSRNDIFVLEADEYDTAFFDKRSKFVHYRPRTAILNNLEYDHADIFPDLPAIKVQFHHLIRTVPSSGLLIVNGEDKNLLDVLGMGCWTPVEQFDSTSGWHARALEPDGSRFQVLFQGKEVGSVAWPLIGNYNVSNALAAIAAARHAGVSATTAVEALGQFRGVRRRLEICGAVSGITVYDDFAHHPTAVEATLSALRTRAGTARIIAVVEPRSNTMRLGVMKERLAPSLAGADRVYCYAGGLTWDAAGALEPLGAKAETHADFNTLLERLVAALKPGDHVVIMSNGSFNGIHEKLLARLPQKAVNR